MDANEIAARLDIMELLAHYSDCLSARDWDRWMGLFSDDATLDYTSAGGVAGSAAAARAWLEPTMTIFDLLHYTIANITIVFDGPDRASVGSAFTGTMRIPGTDGADPTWIATGGNYRDIVKRTQEGWRIASRVERFGFARM